MATYFVGGGIESFVASPAGHTASGASIFFPGVENGAYADAIPRDPETGAQVALDTFWFHCACSGQGSRDKPNVVMFNQADQAVLQIASGNGSSQLQVFRNGAWVALGDLVQNGQNYTFDIRVVAHPTAGRLSFCINGVTVVERGGMDTSYLTGINRIRLQGANTQNGSWGNTMGEVIIASYNTIGHTVRYRTPSADASNAGWAGTYTDVNEYALNDTTQLNTSLVGAEILFDGNVLPPSTPGNVIKAIGVATRIRNDGGAVPRNAKATLRIGGKPYSAPFNFNVGPGFAGAVTVFDKDPSTGLPWANVTNVNTPFGLTSTD